MAPAARAAADKAAADAKAADAKAAADKAAEARAAAARAAEAKAGETKATEARAVDPKDAEAKNFVIQLGAFSEVNRAKDRHAQLVKAGIKSYTEVIKTPTGDKTRVRAGPFPTRQAAEQANERVKALGMTDGIVVPRRY
jgi:DedD protein